MRTGSLFQRLGRIEEKKSIGGAHFLHRRADEIVPHTTCSVGFQVPIMRVEDEQWVRQGRSALPSKLDIGR